MSLSGIKSDKTFAVLGQLGKPKSFLFAKCWNNLRENFLQRQKCTCISLEFSSIALKRFGYPSTSFSGDFAGIVAHLS